MDRNSKETLRDWAHKAIAESSIPEEKRAEALSVALAEIERGGWRGNVSDKWRELGYNGADIPDFYP